MSSSKAGKRTLIKVGVSSFSAAYVVCGIKSWEHEVDGLSIDDSEINTNYVKRIRGLMDAKLTLDMGRRADNTLGQGALFNAMRDGTVLYVQVRGINEFEFRQPMLISKLTCAASVDNRVTLQCELQGIGAIDIAVAGIAIGTEGGDYIMTEGGDYIATEGV